MKRVTVLGLALLLLAAAPAAAKDGAQAHLLAPLPTHPTPGSSIMVRWTVDVPSTNGESVPFGAIGMFARVVSRSGASTTLTASQTHGPYSVRIRVPRGGLRIIRFGLHGYNTLLHRTADIFFPLR